MQVHTSRALDLAVRLFTRFQLSCLQAVRVMIRKLSLK